MKRFLISLGLLLLSLGIAGSVILLGVYQWAVADLPDFKRVSDYQPPQATTVLARDGSLIGLLYKEKRFMVTLEEMSPWLPKALLAVEDSEFYSHKGVDPMAILRAFLVNLRSGKHAQGGSTITQQVIKRLLLSPERTYERKLKEAILAYRLETHLSKDEILTIYLNQSFLGAGAYGVEAAARVYFGKHCRDLTLAESALIAGLPQAPSAYNPLNHPEAARSRQLHVLKRMLELQWITEEQYNSACNEKMVYHSMSEGAGRYAAWYMEEVRRQLAELFSQDNAQALGLNLPYHGEQAVAELGLTVKTAMEPEAQLAADRALRRGLEEADKRHGWRGAVRHLEPHEVEAFLEKQKFSPERLCGGELVKAVVRQASAKEVRVRMGRYSGVIPAANMRWARKTSTKAKRGTSIRSLAPGDVIWVTAASSLDPKTKKQIPYDPAAVSVSRPIVLRLEQLPEVQGALVSMEPSTGDVVAVCGGYSFLESQFNRAVQARRQPGSSFKPVVYSAALDGGMTPVSIVMDSPVVVVDESTSKIWRPGNFERSFRGPLTLRTALASSRNMCSIRLAQHVGVETVIQRAKDLGLTPDFPPYLSISLGSVEVAPLNLAEAYTAFANGGIRARARFILEVKDRDGNILYEPAPDLSEAISPQNAYLMSYMLKQVVQVGTATRARVLGRPLAGKTGTSNDERDAWFMGFTPHLVTGVYVGYDQSRPMGRNETGTRAALPIFISYAQDVFKRYPPDDFAIPDGVVTAVVNKDTGMASREGMAGSITVPFYEGTGPNVDIFGGEFDTGQQGEELLKNLF